MSDKEMIAALRNDIGALGLIYQRHRSYSLRFMQKMLDDFDVVLDVYQDAIILFYEKVQIPDFELTCSIQTYLNSICRNQILKRYKEKSRSLVNSEEIIEGITDWFEEDDHSDSAQLDAMNEALAQLKESGGQCYEILKRYYYYKQSMQVIAEALGYSNGDNVKNQKSRCQKKLKALVTKAN
jgi:RNA polymerase sigma factor (sigma-70 family)